MPARNIYHDSVVRALIADGWTITHDPLWISFGVRNLYVDLGAERPTIAAEKAGQRIAVEIASFLNPSVIHDLELAVGQFEIYRSIFAETGSDRTLYLAIPRLIYQQVLSDTFGQMIVNRLRLRLLVFLEEGGDSLQWIN